jgi:hypothetical protein
MTHSAESRGTPVPPAVTRPVRTGGMQGAIRPPYLPGGSSHTAAQPAAPPEPAADDLLTEAAAWPSLPEQDTAAPAWGMDSHEGDADSGAQTETAADADDFPLDAFFVPADATRSPSGYDVSEHDAISERTAGRLDDLARFIRLRGVTGLDAHQSSDELTRLITAVITGFVAREQ